MLFLREIHRVVGREEADFEAAFREGWMPALAEDEDARLLWYASQAHGGGPSYRVVTYTGVRDGAAYQRLAERVRSGDLQAWAREVDEHRHDVQGSIHRTLPWNPFAVDLDDVPTEPADHEPTIYLEDTMWPHPGQLDAYLEAAGDVYAPYIDRDDGSAWLRVHLALQSVPGAGVHPEVILLQKVRDVRALVKVMASEFPAEQRQPGTWMHDALQYRDRWRSRVLRTAPWSPLT